MSSEDNILIANDGRACLSDVGMNARLLKVTYSKGWPIPSAWVFKALEELSPQCDPALFWNTGAMDVYSFACTVFTVSLDIFSTSSYLDTYHLQIFTSKLPFSSKPYGRGMNEKMAGGRSIEKPAEISSALWSLLQRCLSYNPEGRPSMTAVEAELMSM
jgi:serine/threonine protein kinase